MGCYQQIVGTQLLPIFLQFRPSIGTVLLSSTVRSLFYNREFRFIGAPLQKVQLGVQGKGFLTVSADKLLLVFTLVNGGQPGDGGGVVDFYLLIAESGAVLDKARSRRKLRYHWHDSRLRITRYRILAP